MVKDNVLKINGNDNVAIAIQPVKKGTPIVYKGQALFDAANDIETGHKVALTQIKSGDMVIRYGHPILVAVTDIIQGEWVHLHNAQPITVSSN